MPLGATIRSLFGPYERQVTNAYRAIYVDLDDWMACIAHWVPQAHRILEVGCGEGAMTERLCAHFPQADVVAIDITPRLGRLFSGNPQKVSFRQVPVQTIAAEAPASFDLVLISDVVHHVPPQYRMGLLDAAKVALAPGGTLLFKEWIRSRDPIHWMCEASDRYLTGDNVVYLDDAEADQLIESAYGTGAILDTCHVKPWRNNKAMLLKPAG